MHAIANWTLSRPFVASAALHEGALVANYPWDGSEDKSTKYVQSPDDATFKHMAAAYATWHKTMSKPNNKASFVGCGNPAFEMWEGACAGMKPAKPCAARESACAGVSKRGHHKRCRLVSDIRQHARLELHCGGVL